MYSFPFLQGGASYVSREAAIQSEILNKLLPIDAAPLTFCAASSSTLALLRPWPKAFTLEELSEASSKPFEDDGFVSKEEVLAIVFQIIWTLAVLQTKFSGYQHNSLPENIRLYSYGSARCYKIRDNIGGTHISNGTAYYIDRFLPLPVIVKWKTSTCLLEKNSDIPFRTSESKPGKDLNDVLSAILSSININLPPPQFREIVQLKKECTLYFTNIIYKKSLDTLPLSLKSFSQEEDEVYFEKHERGDNICVPQILALECPSGYSPLPKKQGEMLYCGTCERLPQDTEEPQVIFRNGEYECSNTTVLRKTDRMTSKYFQMFLEPVEVPKHGFALVNGFY